MTGLRIFVHSVRLVLRNLGEALRISAVLYSVQAAAQVAFFMATAEATTPGPDGGAGLAAAASLPVALLSVAGVVASLWIAVAWHRFVLAEEYPEGWLPRWHGGNILLYFWRSLLIGVLIVVIAVVLGVMLSALLVASGPGAVLVPVLVTAAAAVLFLRLSPALPAAALDRPLGIGEAWARTAGHTGDLLVLALLTGAFATLLQLPALATGGAPGVFGLIYGIVLGWFGTLVGASVLTTIYGVTVEGRSLD